MNDDDGEMGNFFPNTDFSFSEMRQRVLDEWNSRERKNVFS